MIFEITRVSMRENEKPYDKCFEMKIQDIDTWGLELDTIEDLWEFKKSVDEELIITVSDIDGKTPTIEIYDTYRE